MTSREWSDVVAKIKFCGIMQPGDAAVAAEAGAAYLGVVFAGGLRAVPVVGAQLHGPYSRADAARLRAHGLRVWRVLRIAGPSDLDMLGEAALDSDAVLVEPRVTHALGGVGSSVLRPDAGWRARWLSPGA
jgi:phosphoribosylanthranilate isomerase